MPQLDHFRHVGGASEATFQQRYFICDEYWGPAGASGGREAGGVGGRGGERAPVGAKGPIFFYVSAFCRCSDTSPSAHYRGSCRTPTGTIQAFEGCDQSKKVIEKKSGPRLAPGCEILDHSCF